MILPKIASNMSYMSVTNALVALGANLPGPFGEADATLRAALTALNDVTSHSVNHSRLYRTPAMPAGSGPDFVNAAAAIEWTGSPAELLSRLQDVEHEFGRTRTHRWEARVLDLDLLAMGDLVWPDSQTEAHWRGLSFDEARVQTPSSLILPHPRMAERAFVLVPLRDVAPHWRHPVTTLTVTEMCAALSPESVAEISPL